MVIDVSKNFGRQPIKHVVTSRRSREMFCDKCRYGRKLVWHDELQRIVCPECGQTPDALLKKMKDFEDNYEPGTADHTTLVTADGFESSGRPTNLTSMRMRAKFGPRSYTTINKDEFGPIDDETKQMLESNPSYKLVDYKETIPGE